MRLVHSHKAPGLTMNNLITDFFISEKNSHTLCKGHPLAVLTAGLDFGINTYYFYIGPTTEAIIIRPHN